MSSRVSRNLLKSEVKVSPEFVTVREIGCSEAVVARVLGRQKLEDGADRIWLDRLIHRHYQDEIGDEKVYWRASGCFVTELCGPYDRGSDQKK